MPSIKDTLTAIVASHARAKEVLLCPDPSGDDCQRAIDALDKAVAPLLPDFLPEGWALCAACGFPVIPGTEQPYSGQTLCNICGSATQR